MDKPKKTKKRIAFCGTRGLPANYGGFETAVDEITAFFTEMGYDCDVLCRETSNDSREDTVYEGRNLVYVKGSSSRKLDTVVSSIYTGIYLLKNRRKYDYVFWFNNANLFGILLTMFCGIPFAVNTDGLEWKRAKWSLPFKAYYWFSSFLISLFCRRLISDSVSIKKYYKEHFFKKTHFIPYGIPKTHHYSENEKRKVLEKYGVEEGKYFLQITRFEPDNLPYDIVKGFIESNVSNQGFNMVLIGYKESTPYADEIKALGNAKGVKILDALYDQKELTILRENAFCYFHGNSVGGTNPALLEAMTNCRRIMAIDGPFSREVLSEKGMFFSISTLPNDFKSVLEKNDQLSLFRERISHYSWKEVSKCYIDLVEGRTPNYMDGGK